METASRRQGATEAGRASALPLILEAITTTIYGIVTITCWTAAAYFGAPYAARLVAFVAGVLS